MGVTNTLTLSRGGYVHGLKSYTIQEDAVSLDPAARSGGVGQVSVGVGDSRDTKFALGGTLTLETDYGTVTGARVLDVSGSSGEASLVADGVLGRTISNHAVPPFQGSVRDLITSYLARVNIVPTFDPAVPNTVYAFPGWSGTMWEFLKDLLIAHKLEVVTVEGVPHFRPIRQYVLDKPQLTEDTYTVSRQDTSKQVAINWYNSSWRVAGEVFPGTEAGYQDAQIFQVDAGASLVTTIQVDATLTAVNQPTCVSFVAKGDYSGTGGVYAVAGSDGNPIPPAQWLAGGGRVSVRIMPDSPGTLELTVVGSNDKSYAPYSLAVISVEGALYNALHITGTGTFTNTETAVLETGSSTAVTGDSMGVTVDNIFIGSPSQAFDIGLRAAQAKNLSHTWSGSTPYSTLGALVGGRVRIEDAMFRVNDTGFNPDIVNLSASADTTASDFDAVWGGSATTAQFDAIWAGRIADDFDLAPLWKGTAA